MLTETLLVRFEFWGLVIAAIALPLIVLMALLKSKTIARARLIGCAAFLILLGALDIGLLRSVMVLARSTPGFVDDAVFLSEYSAALYILPYLSAGVGVNLLTHAITHHLPVTTPPGPSGS